MTSDRSAKHWVFVESNTTGTGRLAVTALLARGDDVTFLARQPGKYPFLSPERPGLAVVEVETNDEQAVLSEVVDLQKRRRIDALLTLSEYYVATVAYVARATNLRGLSPEAAKTCRDKVATRAALQAYGLATPRFWHLKHDDSAEELVSSLLYPCVIKPPSESGSKCVRLARSSADALKQIAEIRQARTNDRDQPVDGGVLVEEYLDGAEFSVESLTFQGETQVLGITRKHLSAHPHFAELGHDFPSVLAPSTQATIEKVARSALDAVGFDFGPAHTELRLTSRGPVVIEINPRMAGGMIPEIMRHAMGIDYLDAYLDVLLTGRTDLTFARKGYASIRFITAHGSGTLTGMAGMDMARRLSLIQAVTVVKALGSQVRPAQNAYDRIGYVIGSGADAAAVRLGVDSALDLVRCIIEAAPTRSSSRSSDELASPVPISRR